MSVGAKTVVNSKLVSFMVSACVHTWIGAANSSETRNFSLPNDGDDFIDAFFNYLFEKAELVMQANAAVYEGLMKDGHNVAFTELFREAAIRECTKVSGIGFNSAKFDTNHMFRHMVVNGRKIDSLFGSSSNHKQIIVSHAHSEVRLRFIDIRNYVAGGSLDEFTWNFGSSGERVKGFFPYEHVTLANWREVLYLSEPFEHHHFQSSLSNGNISDADHRVYRETTAPFKSRLDYFIHYCNVDVEAMIEPINNLIEIHIEFGIIMLHDHALSSNAAAIKRIYAYRDFNVSATHEKTFVKPLDRISITVQYWNYKVLGYMRQDRYKQRDTANNVNDGDFEYYEDIFKRSPCYLCGEWFTWKHNRPTLDRINNSLGHTRDNTKPCRIHCNSVKYNKNALVTQLMIDLRKYAIERGLPMTLGSADTEAYYIIRKGITGGLLNDQHWLSLKGITPIDKSIYEACTDIVQDIDTRHIMTHFCGIDLNSLYPSAFSSQSHEFTKYTGGRTLMPGRLESCMTVTTEKQMKRAMGIIFNRETLFLAEVTGRIPKDRLNECIKLLTHLPQRDDQLQQGGHRGLHVRLLCEKLSTDRQA